MKFLMKSKESFEKFYSNADPWKEKERINRIFYKKILLSFLRSIRQHPTIEIGCGEGEHFFSIFLNVIENKYYGIDIADNAINRAISRLNQKQKESTQIEFLQGNFQSAVKVANDSQSDSVNIIILESLYYLSDKEIIDFFKCLIATNKKITLLISSLNVNELEGREYLTLKKIQKIISTLKSKSISLSGYYPITMKKKSILFPIWFINTALRGNRLNTNESVLCKFSAARNNLFVLKVNTH